MPTRDDLYKYLQEKADQDERLKEAADLRAQGQLAGALSKASSMMGSLGGATAKPMGISDISESMYKTTQDEIKADGAASDREYKLQLLRQKLADKSSSNDRGKIVTGYTKPGYILRDTPNGLVEEPLPKNFEPTKPKPKTSPKPTSKIGPVEKAQIGKLGGQVAGQTSIINVLEAGKQEYERALASGDEDLAIQIGNGMIKALNSDQGPDAVGNQEAERLSPYLQFKKFNLTGPGSFVGRDLDKFGDQLGSSIGKLKGAVQRGQTQLKALESGNPVQFQDDQTVVVRNPETGEELEIPRSDLSDAEGDGFEVVE